MKVVVLCSGGMDSVTALHWARREHDLCAAVSFDYGSKHNPRELPCAAEQARALGLADAERLPVHSALALDLDLEARRERVEDFRNLLGHEY